MHSKRALAAYAAAGLPLAAAALPVYVHAPKFYAELGLDLALIGVLLLAVRVLDAVSDPLLGLLADRIPARWGGHKAQLAAASATAASAAGKGRARRLIGLPPRSRWEADGSR